MITIEYYEDVNVGGVTIRSRRGLKGTEEDGMLEVFEIIGSKCGIYQGKQENWQTGILYSPDKFTYEEAMEDWKNKNLPKFMKVVA